VSAKRLDILLSFYDKYDWSIENLAKTIENLARMLPANPTAAAVGVPLEEAFRIGSHNLI